MYLERLVQVLLSVNLVQFSDFRILDACKTIESSISRDSGFYKPGDPKFADDTSHYAISSSENSVCSVEPGSLNDLSTIIKIIGQARVPFAVKGGGHTGNRGFSSTTGVHISMTRFNKTTYYENNETADIGAGLIWDDAYAELEKHGVSVAGGRDTGVGVAGFTLGGGYSWFSNEYGLAIDNVLAYEIVLTDGTITTATSTINKDLFFALKGGGNNFGIVTKFTFKTFKTDKVWGGPIYFNLKNTPVSQLIKTIVDFNSNNKDKKASILPTFDATFGKFEVLKPQVATILLFYNAPKPPSSTFAAFLNHPGVYKIGARSRSIVSLVKSVPSNSMRGNRGIYNMISVRNVTTAVVNECVEQALYWGNASSKDRKSPRLISVSVEPFLSSYFDYSKGGAYPHDPSFVHYPIFLFFAWNSKATAADGYYLNAIKQAAESIANVARREGQQDVNKILYSNYALPGTELWQLWGSNVDVLKKTKGDYDPNNVTGLAGGFKL